MAHVTFRIDDVTMERVGTLCAARKMSKSAALKELIVLGLEVSAGGFASVHEAVGRIGGQVETLQELLSETLTSQDETLRSVHRAAEIQFDLLVKLGIENVMINRSLALTRGRPFLNDAQQSAREYYANRFEEAAREQTESPELQGKVA